MATYNGNTSGSFRLVAEVTGTGSTRTITIYGQSIGYGHNWSGTLKRSGAWSGTKSVSFYSGSNQTVKKQFYKATVSKSGTYKASISYWNGSSSVSVPVSITPTAPTKPTKPSTPGKPAWKRTGPNTGTLSWGAMSRATSYPIQYQYNSTSGAVGSAAAVTGTSTTRSMTANRRYRYRVAARNAGGTSEYSSWSDWFYTTPKAPSGVKATPASDTSAKITWVTNAAYPYGAQVERRGSSGLSAVGTGLATASKTYTRTGIPAAQLPGSQYRVRTFAGPNNSTRGRAYSAWSGWSAKVSVLKTANPPTNLTPDGSYVPDTTPVTLRWRHNPADGTAQEGAQVVVRAQGGEWSTELGGVSEIGEASSYELAQSHWEWLLDELSAHETTVVEWQARTQGANGVYSDWSATAQFDVVALPEVTVTDPADGENYVSNIATAEWGFSQAEGLPQSRWEAVLSTGDGDELEARSGTGDGQTARFQTVLEDDTDYIVSVRAQSAGLWSDWESATFTTEFILPRLPDLTVDWVEEVGGHEVAVSPGSEGGEHEPTAALQLFRSVDGGSTWEEATGQLDPTEQTILDFQGLSAGMTWYRAAAYSALGAMAYQDVGSEADSEDVWLQAGPDYADPLRFSYNPEWGRATGRQRETVQYLGHESPVAYVGEAVADTFTVGGTLIAGDPHTADADELVAVLQANYPTVLYRDPTGAHVYAAASDLQLSRENHALTSWSTTLTRVRPDAAEAVFEEDHVSDDDDTGDGDDD